MVSEPDITYIYHREPEKDAIGVIYPDCPQPTCEDARYLGQLRIWRRHGVVFVASWNECAAYKLDRTRYKLIDRTPVTSNYGCCLYPAGMFIADPHNHFVYAFVDDKFTPVSFDLIPESPTNEVLQLRCGTTLVRGEIHPRIYNMRVDPPVYIEADCACLDTPSRGVNLFHG